MWVYWTLLAALMQAVRTAGQKGLSQHVTPLSATLVRYLFGLPFAIFWLVYLLSDRAQGSGTDVSALLAEIPELNARFLVSGMIAGLLQIVATLLLIRLMTLRNFAVGSTYAKSEILLTAMIGFMFFAEHIHGVAWFAIGVSVVGLVMVSVAKSGGLATLWNQSALYGLGAGLCFALTSLFLRKASLSLAVTDAPLSASITLVYMVTLQTVVTLIAVRLMQAGQIRLVFKYWRVAIFIGLTSVAGSVGWFTAMTLELASYVKTLGQMEFFFTVLIAIFYFKEVPDRKEWLGMLLILVGSITLLLA